MAGHRFFSFYARSGVLYVRFKDEFSRRYGSGKCTGFDVDEREDADFAVRAYLQGLRAGFRKANDDPSARISAQDLLGIQRLITGLHTLPLGADDVQRINSILRERRLLDEPKRLFPVLVAFLEDFWCFESSEYVSAQLNKGKRISRRHCYDQGKHVSNHWNKYFGQKKLDQVGLGELESFGNYLKAQGLTGKSINNVMNAGVVPLSWAFERKLIPADPTQGFSKFAVRTKARGILTPDEVKELFGMKWDDERARLGNLLACTCGLRAGEILALRPKDLEGSDEQSYVATSWSPKDLFTDPKWGSFRDTSMMNPIKEALLTIASKSPYRNEPGVVIFHGRVAGRPRGTEYLLDSLKDMLLKLNPDPEYWKKRRVVFHSWRHYFTARMSDMLDEPTLMKTTGHKTKDAFDEYVNHLSPEQFLRVREAQTCLFGELK